MHKQNLHNLSKMIDLAIQLDAERLSSTSSILWMGLKKSNAFLPSREQLDKATKIVEEARVKYRGILAIDYVVPDYYAKTKVIWGDGQTI